MKAWERVKRVINQSDVVIEVVDARFPERSKKIERIVKRKKKKLILVVNKIDLNPKVKIKNAILFCAKTGKGKRKLLNELEKIAKEFGRSIKVGVVGKPNVGKSTLINKLKGKKSARTSPEAGFTKGEQWIRISPKILLIDSPGVILEKESKEELALKNYMSVEKLKDPVKAAFRLFKKYPEVLNKLKLKGNDEEALKEFALRHGKLKKGGKPNIEEAARMIIRKWQRGEI